MNKKKGFTLIELLAVIVILAVILLIGVMAVVPLITKSKKNSLVNEGVALIKSSKIAFNDEQLESSELHLSPNKSYCFSLDWLRDHNYYDKASDNYNGSVLVYVNKDGTFSYYYWITNGKYHINAGTGEKYVVENGKGDDNIYQCGGMNIDVCHKAEPITEITNEMCTDIANHTSSLVPKITNYVRQFRRAFDELALITDGLDDSDDNDDYDYNKYTEIMNQFDHYLTVIEKAITVSNQHCEGTNYFFDVHIDNIIDGEQLLPEPIEITVQAPFPYTYSLGDLAYATSGDMIDGEHNGMYKGDLLMNLQNYYSKFDIIYQGQSLREMMQGKTQMQSLGNNQKKTYKLEPLIDNINKKYSMTPVLSSTEECGDDYWCVLDSQGEFFSARIMMLALSLYYSPYTIIYNPTGTAKDVTFSYSHTFTVMDTHELAFIQINPDNLLKKFLQFFTNFVDKEDYEIDFKYAKLPTNSQGSGSVTVTVDPGVNFMLAVPYPLMQTLLDYISPYFNNLQELIDDVMVKLEDIMNEEQNNYPAPNSYNIQKRSASYLTPVSSPIGDALGILDQFSNFWNSDEIKLLYDGSMTYSFDTCSIGSTINWQHLKINIPKELYEVAGVIIKELSRDESSEDDLKI